MMGVKPSRNVPHGQRECRYCAFHHPERAEKPCSALGACWNKEKDCSLYIDDPDKREE